MIARLTGLVLAPLTDLVAAGLRRGADAVRRRRSPGPGTSRPEGTPEGSGMTSPRDPRATEGLVLEVVATAAALALAPIVAGVVVRALTAGIARRRG